jgi:putative nucleotidyltransferase with HDIG domain
MFFMDGTPVSSEAWAMDNTRAKAILDKVDMLMVTPALLPKLLTQLSDVDANFDDVVEIISMEQALTAKLLRICNSAFFGQEEPITTVSDAVNRVGYQSIYLLAAMINGSNSFPTPSPEGINTSKLWRHSVATAFNSKYVAESAGLDANMLFTGGLMHDIGKIVLAQIAHGNEIPPFHLPSTVDSLAHEKKLFDCDHAEIGAALLQKWSLPAPLIVCVQHHHDASATSDTQKISACIAIANAVAHSPVHPDTLETPEFAAAMTLLELDASHQKRWRRLFDDAQDLIMGMSKLPL